MGQPHLKWANLWRLGEIFCKTNDLNLIKVVFCTAVPQDDLGKRDRHNAFNAAQIASGVTVIKGHHVFEPGSNKRSEKQSDINLALSLMMDAEDDVFDWAFVLSADSDQAATARFFSERHPSKALVGVAPPTKTVPAKVIPYCISHFVMTVDQLEQAVMPAFVPGTSRNLIRMPSAYAPPSGWVHPDNRPKKPAKP